MIKLVSDTRRGLAETGRSSKGFSLVELIVVAAILVTLSAIAIPLFLNQRDKARSNAVKTATRNLYSEIEAQRTSDNTAMSAGATLATAVTASGWTPGKPGTYIVYPNCTLNGGITASADPATATNQYVIFSVRTAGGGSSLWVADQNFYDSLSSTWYDSAKAISLGGSIGSIYNSLEATCPDSGNTKHWLAQNLS